jgi:SAM-dependent methyltransferase
MNPFLQQNKLWWNEAAGIHAGSKFYDVEGFKQGKSTLKSVESEKLGDLSGKSLLHLQCHFGMDTLSLARRGATVTGADFSEEAIELARGLNVELGLTAEFVCSNLYDLPDNLTGQFDIVYTSYGVLCWLNDLPRWGEVIAHFLKPGGMFLIVEGHPVANVFELDPIAKGRLMIDFPYFYDPAPQKEDGEGSYADRQARKKHKTTYEWPHSISEIMNALWSAGLAIESFEEYPYCFYEKYEGMMRQNEAGWWEFTDGKLNLPLMFSLTARKE